MTSYFRSKEASLAWLVVCTVFERSGCCFSPPVLILLTGLILAGAKGRRYTGLFAHEWIILCFLMVSLSFLAQRLIVSSMSKGILLSGCIRLFGDQMQRLAACCQGTMSPSSLTFRRIEPSPTLRILDLQGGERVSQEHNQGQSQDQDLDSSWVLV